MRCSACGTTNPLQERESFGERIGTGGTVILLAVMGTLMLILGVWLVYELVTLGRVNPLLLGAGALIVVAHDRHLLRATTDALWLVADGLVQPFDGDLDDYRDWVLARGRRPFGSVEPPSGASRKAQRRAEAQERQRDYAKRKPYADRLAKREQGLAALDAERRAVEDWLASPDAYADARKDELKERLARQGDLRWQLAALVPHRAFSRIDCAVLPMFVKVGVSHLR